MNIHIDANFGARSKQRLIALDGLRGIAALAVAIGHLYPGLFYNTTLAVDFFFMLSAFVLFQAYSEKLGKNIFFLGFMLRRFIRLLPLVALGTLIGLIALKSADGVFGAVLIPSLGPLMYPLNPPCWSLFFEIIASALFGLGMWQKATWLNLAFLVASGSALAFGVFHRGDIDAGWKLQAFHYGFTRVIFGFSVGTAIYLFQPKIRIPTMVIVTVFTITLMMPIHSALYQFISLFIVMPLTLAAGARAQPFKGGEIIGDISYPLYIIHFPIFIIFDSINKPVQLLLALVVAFFSLKFYDEPTRRHLTKLLL